jgi:hypothetical protein
MWSDLGDTLQEVVQRNLKLEEENRRLLQEMEEIDQQILAADQALQIMGFDLSFQAGGASSSSAVVGAPVGWFGYAVPTSAAGVPVGDICVAGRESVLEENSVVMEAAMVTAVPRPPPVAPAAEPAATVRAGRFNFSVAVQPTAPAAVVPEAERPRRSLEMEDTDALVTVRRCAGSAGDVVAAGLVAERPVDEVLRVNSGQISDTDATVAAVAQHLLEEALLPTTEPG